MNYKDINKERTTKIALMGLTAIVMISGNGTNVDETDCPAAKIKEFSQSNQVVQISKPEKLKTLKQIWSKMNQNIQNKKNYELIVNDISFDDKDNISYRGVKSQEIVFLKPKVKNNISYDINDFIIPPKEDSSPKNNNSITATKSKYT